MFGLLTQEVAHEIIREWRQRMEADMEVGVIDDNGCHIVVLNPLITFGMGYDDGYGRYHPYTFKEVVLAEDSLFPIEGQQWHYPYDKIARSKAEITWRTGKTTHEIAALYPHLRTDDDTPYAGSAIFMGIIVAVSGFDEWRDLVYSYQIAVDLWAKAMELDNAKTAT